MANNWWRDDYNNSWERAKEALRRDWEQTRHDFGGDAPDLKQDVADTARQAAGKQAIPAPGEPNFDRHEPAFRYGHGARLHYGTRNWDEAFENEVSQGYQGNWAQDRQAVRYAYDRTVRT